MQKNKHQNTKSATTAASKQTKSAGSKESKVYTFVPFIVFALALIVETCLIFSDGTGVVGKALHGLFTGLFGAVAYLIPAGAIVIAYLYFDMNKRKTTVYKIIMLSVFTLFFAAANSILAFDGIVENAFSASVSWNGGKAGQGGGFFGGLLGKLLAAMFGRVFGAVVAILITVLSLSFFIGSAFPGLWGMIFSRKNAPRAEKSNEPVAPPRFEPKPAPTPKFNPAPTQPPRFEPTPIPENQPKRTVREYPVDVPRTSHKKVDTTISDPFSYGDVFLKNMSGSSVSEAPAEEVKAEPTPTPTSYQNEYRAEPRSSYSSSQTQSGTSTKSSYSSYGKTSASKSKVYSPFSNPFVSMDDVFGDGKNSGGNGSQKRTGERKSMAYSPFGNPFADIDDSLKEVREKDSRSQAYIAYESTVDPSQRQSARRESRENNERYQQPPQQTQPQGSIFDTVIDSGGAMRDADDVRHTKGTVDAGFTPTAETVPPADGGSYTSRFSEQAESVSPNREVRQEADTAEYTETSEPENGSVLTPFDYKTMKPLGGSSRTESEPTRPVYDEYSEDTDTSSDENDGDDDGFDVVSSTENVTVTRGIPERENKPRKPLQMKFDTEEDENRTVTPRSERRYPNYAFPEFGLLDPQMQNSAVTDEDILEVKNKLLGKLASFRVEASLSGYSVGPTVTRYELTPGPGVKVKSITSLIEDIALELQSDGVRIATVPGKSVIGVEVPNKKVTVVSLRSLIENRDFINAKSKITVCVGLTVTGKPVYMDIDDMPHVLIAGQTKAGKSVAINCMLLSLLYRATPDEVQLILIDPKRVELNIYSKLPHLVMPVIDDPQRAAAALNWAVVEMERRYALLDKFGVRNREEYYELKAENPSLELMPQIVIVIDELADLMLQVREHVESLINRLAAMARACGIHLLIGTQRPSVDIITGLIKANIPARISFKVSSSADSRIILGNIGAEKLLGRGDMLYQATGCGRVRVQGAFVTSSEIKRITRFIIDNNGEAQFDPEIMRHLDSEVDKMNKDRKKGGASYGDGDDDDGIVDTSEVDFDYLCRAIEYAIETDRVATNNIQRHLRIGFNRAADIVDRMEELGFISPRNGSKPREVLVTWDKYEQWKYNRMP